MKNNFYLALIHYPVLNKFGDIINTSITNLDIHDIARSCCTFGIKNYFIVTPLESQKEMLDRILGFWNGKTAQKYNSDRSQALSLIQYAASVQDVVEFIISQEKLDPVIVSTTAVKRDDQISFDHFKEVIFSSKRPCLLLFGTGNGLTENLITASDYILKPVLGNTEYNHLSVRSAAAVIMDRLLSEK